MSYYKEPLIKILVRKYRGVELTVRGDLVELEIQMMVDLSKVLNGMNFPSRAL